MARVGAVIPAGAWRGAVLLGGFALLAHSYRVGGHHLGDSDMWFRRLGRLDAFSLGQIPLFESLDFLVHLGIYRVAGPLFGWTPQATYEWVSIGAGMAYLALAWRIAGMLGPDRASRITLMALVSTLGTMQLFFGYGESYTLVAVAVALYLWCGLRALAGGPLLHAVLAWLLATALHALALSLLPSLAFLVWYRRGRPGAGLGGGRGRRLVVGAVAAALALAGYQAFYPYPLPLFRAAAEGEHALFSWAHLLLLGNALLLISPFGLWWGIGCRNAHRPASPVAAMLGWAVLGSAGLIAVHNAFLGGRDWDLLSFPGLALMLWGWVRLRQGAEFDRDALRGVWLAVVPLMVLHTALWIGINADTQRAAQRLGNLLQHMNQPAHYREFSLGHYYLNIAGDPAKAATHFQGAIDLSPPDAQDPDGNYRNRYRIFLGRSQVAAAAYGEALSTFGIVRLQLADGAIILDADLHRDWAVAGLRQGWVYAAQGDTARARVLWTAAIGRCREVLGMVKMPGLYLPMAQAYEALRDLETAEEFYRLAITEGREREQVLAAYAGLAHLLEARGDRQGGIALLEQGAAAFPDEGRPCRQLGELHTAAGDPRRALDWYQEAVRRGDQEPGVYAGLGQALAGLGRASEAVQLLEGQLQSRPQSQELHLALGKALSAAGDTAGAIGSYEQALSLGEGDPATHLALAGILRDLGRRDAAVEHYRQILEGVPASGPASVYVQTAIDLDGLGSGDDAIRAYRRALQVDPADEVALVNLGWKRYEQGELEQAKALFRESLAARPTSVALFNLGLVQLHLGLVAEAQRTYAAAVARYGSAEGRKIGADQDLRRLAGAGIQAGEARQLLATYWP